MTGLFIKNSLPWHLRLRSALPGTIVLACACAILLLTAPTNGDFWWFDAPGHAMDGVFVHDFVTAMPWRDPVRFAIDYYMRYPAVTILFYPPLFPIVEAFFFALFGVSHFVAQLTVTAFLLAFALGTRQLARLWMTDAAAVGVGAYRARVAARHFLGPTGDARDAGLRIPDLVRVLSRSLSAR